MDLFVGVSTIYDTSGEASLPFICLFSFLKTQMKSHDPDWKPLCFLTDACVKEMAAIRTVYGDSVPNFICTWHMHKATMSHLKAMVRTLKPEEVKLRWCTIDVPAKGQMLWSWL